MCLKYRYITAFLCNAIHCLRADAKHYIYSFIHLFTHIPMLTTRMLLQIITQYEEIVQNANTRLVT